MKNLKLVFAGFVLGAFVAIAPACGTAKQCSASTCPAGCCDAKGECQAGASNNACGQLGAACQMCSLGQSCSLGTCSGGTGAGGGTTGGGGGTTGGGTGGGTTGGGTGGGTTGGGTGGGGATCDGCFFNGNCIIRANSNNNTICGQGGVQCATCSGAQNCVNYVCVAGTGGGGGTTGGGGGTTGGGGGTTGGGGGTTGQPVGGPCTSSANCQAGLTCRTATQRGDATYPGGYCSKTCTMDAECGAGAECIGGPNTGLVYFGETDGLCVASCPSAGSQSTCRAGGYTCEFNAAGMPGVCWLDPIPNFNGGGQATASGNPCTVDTQCQNPPSPNLGFCLKPTLPDGGASGWTNGYCSADCALDNTGTFCGPSATCATLGTAPNTYSICLRTCATPGGRSTCRTPGYTCFAFSTGGVCYPDCTITGCSTGTCNTTTGHCQ